MKSSEQAQISWRELENSLSNSDQGVFLVTGKGSYKSSGVQKEIESALEGLELHRYYNFQENPSYEDVNKGIELYKQSNCNTIIGVGGGSAIDMAKLIHLLSELDIDQREDAIRGHINLPTPAVSKSLYAIPTTFGTGSESTHFAVVYIGQEKFSVSSSNALPKAYILDPDLSINLPPYIKACTAMDALSQSIESFWAKGATSESITYSVKALTILAPTIVEFIKSPSIQLATSMAKGSNFAGKAINISKTTAPHALSYAITKRYNIPHGHAVALTLPYFMSLSSRIDKQLVANLKNHLQVPDSNKLDEWLTKLMSDCGLDTVIKPDNYNIECEVREMIASVNIQRLNNHPFEVTQADLHFILSSIFDNKANE